MADEEIAETRERRTVDLGSLFSDEPPATVVVGEPVSAPEAAALAPVSEPTSPARDFGPEISGEGYNYRVQTGVPSDQAAIEYTAADGSASGVRLPGTSAHTAIMEEIGDQGTDGIPPTVAELRQIVEEAKLNKLLDTESGVNVEAIEAERALREAQALQRQRSIVGPAMSDYMTSDERRTAEWVADPWQRRLLRTALTAAPVKMHDSEGRMLSGRPLGARPFNIQAEKPTPTARQRYITPGEEGRPEFAEGLADTQLESGETPRQRLLGVDAEGALLPSWVQDMDTLGATSFNDLTQSERSRVLGLQDQVDAAIAEQSRVVQNLMLRPGWQSPTLRIDRRGEPPAEAYKGAQDFTPQDRQALRASQDNIRLLSQRRNQLNQRAEGALDIEQNLSIPLLMAYVDAAKKRLEQEADAGLDRTNSVRFKRHEEDLRTAAQVLERMQLDATAMGLTDDEIDGAIKAYRESLGGTRANRNQ
jgi:hypothetical protein